MAEVAHRTDQEQRLKPEEMVSKLVELELELTERLNKNPDFLQALAQSYRHSPGSIEEVPIRFDSKGYVFKVFREVDHHEGKQRRTVKISRYDPKRLRRESDTLDYSVYISIPEHFSIPATENNTSIEVSTKTGFQSRKEFLNSQQAIDVARRHFSS